MTVDRDSDKISKEILLLEAGRYEYQSQESLNKEINLKAFGVLAFLVTLSAIILEIVDMDTIPSSLKVIAFLLSMICIGIGFWVLKPYTWYRPFDLMNVMKTLQDFDPDSIAFGLGKGYAETVESNRKILNKKSFWLEWLLRITLGLLVIIVIIVFYDPFLIDLMDAFFQEASDNWEQVCCLPL